MGKFLFGILCVTFVFTSCNLRKTTKGGEIYLNDEVDDKVGLMQLAKDSAFKGKYIYIKSIVKSKIDKEVLTFKVNTRIVKDSCIQLSISKGIPIAKVLITPDSIMIRNDIEQNVLMEDFEYIETLLNFELDFDMLQCLILGNPYFYYDQDKYKYHNDRPYHLLTSVSKRKLKKLVDEEEDEEDEEEELETIEEKDDDLTLLIQGLWFNGYNGKIKSLFIREPKQSRRMWVDYGESIQVEDQKFPSEMKVKIKAKSEKKMTVDVEHTKITIRENLSINFKAPEKYERIH